MLIRCWDTRVQTYPTSQAKSKALNIIERKKESAVHDCKHTKQYFSGKVKVSPLQTMKAHGGCGCKDPHIAYTATTLGRDKVASPTHSRLHPRYSFYRRLSGPQDYSGHQGVKRNLHPSDTRDRIRAVQPVAKHLAAWATWPTFFRYKRIIYPESDLQRYYRQSFNYC